MSATDIELAAPVTVAEPRAIYAWRIQLAALRRDIETADDEEARQTFHAAQNAAKLLVLVKAADELAVEAIRLSCSALRRVGHLGGRGLSSRHQQAARLFAAMDEKEFADAMQSVRSTSTASSIALAWGKENTPTMRATEARRIERQRREESRDLVGAISAVVEDALSGDRPIVIEDLVEQLVGADEETLTRTGAGTKVREAIGHIDRAEDRVFEIGQREWSFGGRPHSARFRVPAKVTYRTDGGWLSVPWHKATVTDVARFADEWVRRTIRLENRCEEYRTLAQVLSATAHGDDNAQGVLARLRREGRLP